jgi:hypothetical protein
VSKESINVLKGLTVCKFLSVHGINTVLIYLLYLFTVVFVDPISCLLSLYKPCVHMGEWSSISIYSKAQHYMLMLISAKEQRVQLSQAAGSSP